jgi:ubiquitin carboxyl-terminal hydrolase 25/28
MALSGKTAPRLINDLLDYDPSRPKQNGRNLLTGDAPQYRGKNLLRKGYQDCHHTLMKKVERTIAPVWKDEQPDGSTKYVLATYCSICLYHFDITVDFRRGNDGQAPCNLSDNENPLHHLRLVDSTNSEEYEQRHGSSKYNTLTEAHRWVCSGATCPVVVSIKISPPRLAKELLSPVTNPKKVNARGRRVIQEEPDRFVGLMPIGPQQALTNLRTYLRDAKEVQDPDKLKKIAKRNKRLLLGFADECDSLFKYLDFTVVEEHGSDPDVVRSPPMHLVSISFLICR